MAKNDRRTETFEPARAWGHHHNAEQEPSTMPGVQGSQSHRVRNTAISAFIGFVVVLPLVWLGAEDWRPFGGSEPEADQPALPTDSPSTTAGEQVTTTTTEAAETTLSTTPEEVPATGEPPTELGGTGPTRYYLAQLSYIDAEIEGRPGRCTGGCTGFDKGAAKIGSATFAQSFITRMDGDGDRSTSTWNALRSCESFEASLGLTNDSDTTSATFTISKDGGPVEVLATVPTGNVVQIPPVDMTGVNRFTIAAYVSGAETEHAEAVWGDAVLTCAAGSLS